MRSSWANGMREGYPCQQLTIMFLQYLLTSRIQQSHASRRKGCERIGRGSTTVGGQFKNMHNHVWPMVFGPAGFPQSKEEFYPVGRPRGGMGCSENRRETEGPTSEVWFLHLYVCVYVGR